MSLNPLSRPHRLSRRGFIATASIFATTAWCGRRPYDKSQFVLPTSSAVGLFPASSYAADFGDIVFRGFLELGVSLKGRRVLLKPNMVEYEAGTAINTHPNVVAGTAIACYRAGADQVIVGEGPGHRRDIEYLLTMTGLQDQLREQRIQFVDLNHDDVRFVPLRSWFTGMRELALPATLLDSDFVISMPKLKTHHWAGMTCSMKNLFGTVPGAVYGWPKNILHAHGIPNSIVDLVATIRPQLAIVDAVTAMEGDGPIMGTAAARRVHRDEPGPRGDGRNVRADHRAGSGQDRLSRSRRRFPWRLRRESHHPSRRTALTLCDSIRRGPGA